MWLNLVVGARLPGPSAAGSSEGVGTDRLREIGRGRIVVMGVGNSLRADDAAGPLVAEMLRRRFPDRVFDVGQVPENFIGPVRRAGPDTILLVDAADFGGAPGEIRVAAGDEAQGLMLGTHAAPLGMFMAAISQETGADAHLLAVQVRSTKVGGTMCQEVSEAVRRIVSELEELLEEASS